MRRLKPDRGTGVVHEQVDVRQFRRQPFDGVHRSSAIAHIKRQRMKCFGSELCHEPRKPLGRSRGV
jgi:hypothetical protein